MVDYWRGHSFLSVQQGEEYIPNMPRIPKIISSPSLLPQPARRFSGARVYAQYTQNAQNGLDGGISMRPVVRKSRIVQKAARQPVRNPDRFNKRRIVCAHARGQKKPRCEHRGGSCPLPPWADSMRGEGYGVAAGSWISG